MKVIKSAPLAITKLIKKLALYVDSIVLDSLLKLDNWL